MSDLSDGEEGILLFPITDIDQPMKDASHSEPEGFGTSGSDADEDEVHKPAMTLRERRIKRAYGVAIPVNRTLQPLNVSKSQSPSSHRIQWLRAFHKARKAKDPWAEFHINDYDCEVCTRYRYNALKKTWVKDDVLVKMETKVRKYILHKFYLGLDKKKNDMLLKQIIDLDGF